MLEFLAVLNSEQSRHSKFLLPSLWIWHYSRLFIALFKRLCLRLRAAIDIDIRLFSAHFRKHRVWRWHVHSSAVFVHRKAPQCGSTAHNQTQHAQVSHQTLELKYAGPSLSPSHLAASSTMTIFVPIHFTLRSASSTWTSSILWSVFFSRWLISDFASKTSPLLSAKSKTSRLKPNLSISHLGNCSDQKTMKDQGFLIVSKPCAKKWVSH